MREVARKLVCKYGTQKLEHLELFPCFLIQVMMMLYHAYHSG